MPLDPSKTTGASEADCLFNIQCRKKSDFFAGRKIAIDEYSVTPPPGAVRCTENVALKPLRSVDRIELAYIPWHPTKKHGPQLLNVTRYMSKSCTRFEYVGVTVVSSRRGDKSMQSTTSKSIQKVGRQKGFSVSASASVSFLKVQAEAAHSTTEESTKSANMTYSMSKVTQIDNVLFISPDDDEFPELSEPFKQTMQKGLAEMAQCRDSCPAAVNGPLRSNESANACPDVQSTEATRTCDRAKDNFFKILARRFPTYLSMATFGSEFAIVSMLVSFLSLPPVLK